MSCRSPDRDRAGCNSIGGGPLSSDDDINSASGKPKSGSKRLPAFISENVEAIVGEWEVFARTLTPASDGMTSDALRDHIIQMLDFIAKDIATSQTPKEQTRKSKGENSKLSDATASETHASVRLADGFDIEQVVSEYRALRASVLKLWGRTRPSMDGEDLESLMRFNESVDQVLAESARYYTRAIVYSKDVVAGILSQDIRDPLQAVTLSTQLLLHTANLTERQVSIAQGALESAARVGVLVDNLLDITRSRFGGEALIVRSPMDAGFVARQALEELQAAHPARPIELDTSGDLTCEWDKARIAQVFSNLLGNAVRHGFKDTPIWVSVKGTPDAIRIEVSNDGPQIASGRMDTIFDPLGRADAAPADKPGQKNLGLGLFITREIVRAHGGDIRVSSSEKDGTVLTVLIPRHKSATVLHIV